MAVQIINVDTDVVGGTGDGSSRANAYDNLRTALSSVAYDLVTAGDSVIFACFGAANDSGVGGTTQSVVSATDGWVTSETNDILIIGDTGGSLLWDDTKYTLSHVWNYNGVLEIGVPHVNVSNCQLENVGTTTSHVIEATETFSVSGCILRNTNGRGNAFQLALVNGSKAVLVNNLCYETNRFCDVGSPDASIEFVICNNTIVGCIGEGIKLTGSSNCTIKNNISVNNGSLDYNLTSTSTTNTANNISSDTSSPNAAFQSLTPVFVDAANDNYHLDPSDTVAKAQGANLSSDPAYSFNVDAQGDVRGATWDIGADQITAPPANSDPTLDSPIADISIPANTSGIVAALSNHFSDIDGDSLTYGVTPDLPLGLSLDPSTGDVTGDGSITQTAAADYTFSVSDGQGGSNATDVVNIEVTEPAFVIDSHGAAMQRGGNFQVVCSNPDVVPTTANTTISNGNDTLACTGVTGTNPYTLTFAVGDLTKQTDANGYAWTLVVGAQNEVTGNVPLNVQTGWGVQSQVDPVTTEGTVWHQSTGDAPATGWHVEHELVTSPDNIAVTITETGGINLASVPTRDQTFQFRAVEPDGTISNTETFTWQQATGADTTPDQFDLGTNLINQEPGTVIQRQFQIAGIDVGETVNITAQGAASVSPSTGQVGDTVNVTLTAGSFGATVSGGAAIGGVTDTFSLTTRAAAVPVITAQPGNQSVSDGQTATFQAAATGASGFQWHDAADDTALPGETSSTLSIVASLSDNGNSYYCVISSSEGGTVQTNTATLTVDALDPNLPVISGPTPPDLTVKIPADFDVLDSSHPEVQSWRDNWSAVDTNGTAIPVSVAIPASMRAGDSPVSIDIVAVDDQNRSATVQALITISKLSAVHSGSLIEGQRTDLYEQRSGQYYEVDD